MSNVLREIAAHTASLLPARKAESQSIERQADEAPACRDFAAALRAPGISVIAEVKRKAPSTGKIDMKADPAAVAGAYVRGGAAAISVLTDEKYFGGELSFLAAVKQATSVPVLRKDFVVDPFQVMEARAAGADAVLLIVAILGADGLSACLAACKQWRISPLVEVHTEAELAIAMATDAPVIGVNQRDLTDFSIDHGRAARFAAMMPRDRIVVGESGIRTDSDVVALRETGVDAVLVGTSLMRSDDREEAVRALAAAGRA